MRLRNLQITVCLVVTIPEKSGVWYWVFIYGYICEAESALDYSTVVENFLPTVPEEQFQVAEIPMVLSVEQPHVLPRHFMYFR